GGNGIYGGDGDDRIDLTGAGYGPSAYGEAGDDYIIGGNSYERLDGGEGNDRIEGNYGYDNLYGGAGNDIIDGGSFDDNLYGEAGNDTLYGAGDVDTIDGGDGDDIIYGDFSLISSAGGISGGPRFETLRGGAGDDFVSGDEGDDRLYGDDGNDRLYGGTGNDSLTGGAGADRMEGGEGNDTGYGGDGEDVILAGTGTDQLSGEGDNDRLYFGADFGGSDLAAGGAGLDQLVLQGNYAALTLAAANIVSVETIRLLSAGDSSIVTAPGGSFSYELTAADSLVSGSNVLRVEAPGLAAGENLRFDGSAETSASFAVVGGAGADLIRTGAGNDSLEGGGGDDTLLGGAGDDLLTGGDGNDSLNGEAGNDTLTGGAGADNLIGGDGNDVYILDSIAHAVIEHPNEGVDEVRIGVPGYVLPANVENLTYTGGFETNLVANAGNNVVTGGDAREVYYMQQGGDDIVRSFGGNDTFVFGATFNAADSIEAGAGTDGLILQGNYPALTFGTGTTSNISGVETISLAPGHFTDWGDTSGSFYDYNVTTLNGNVAAGAVLKFNGFYLRAGEDFTFNGAAETDGKF
ncbi:MAG TPA: calcium-binding protein, partial [Allosphingosinicella sp.]